MLNRWSVVLLLVGAVTGYALGTPGVQAVQAQPEARPFSIGDVVTIRYERLPDEHVQRSVECKVSNIIGNYMRCAADDAGDRSEVWHSLRSVAQILRHPK